MQSRATRPAEMIVGLPSSSPLNQSVGPGCPELDQPQWPCCCFPSRGQPHITALSPRQQHALLNEILFLPLLLPVSRFVFISLRLDVLTLAWSFASQTRVTGHSLFWAVPEFHIRRHSGYHFPCVSRSNQDQYSWKMINKTSCWFWPTVKQACRHRALDWIRLQESCSLNNTDCTFSAETHT